MKVGNNRIDLKIRVLVFFMITFTLFAMVIFAALPSSYAASGVTLVQQNNGSVFCGGSPSCSTSLSVTFPSSVTKGNLIVVGITVSAGSAIGSVTDSLGSTYTTAISADESSGQALAYILYATAPSSGADTVTVQIGSNYNGAIMNIYELSGATTTGLTAGSGTGSSSSASFSSRPLAPRAVRRRCARPLPR